MIALDKQFRKSVSGLSSEEIEDKKDVSAIRNRQYDILQECADDLLELDEGEQTKPGEDLPHGGGDDSNLGGSFQRLSLGTSTHPSTYASPLRSSASPYDNNPSPAAEPLPRTISAPERDRGVGKKYTVSEARKISQRVHDAFKRVNLSFTKYKVPNEDTLRKIGLIDLKPEKGDIVSNDHGHRFQHRGQTLSESGQSSSYDPTYSQPVSTTSAQAFSSGGRLYVTVGNTQKWVDELTNEDRTSLGRLYVVMGKRSKWLDQFSVEERTSLGINQGGSMEQRGQSTVPASFSSQPSGTNPDPRYDDGYDA